MTVMLLSPIFESENDSSTLCPIDLGILGLNQCENNGKAEGTYINQLTDRVGRNSSQTAESPNKQFNSSVHIQDMPIFQLAESGNGENNPIKPSVDSINLDDCQSHTMTIPIQNKSGEATTVPVNENNSLENKISTVSTEKATEIDFNYPNKPPHLKPKKKISKTSPPKIRRQSFVQDVKLDLEELRKPLEQGYVREVVYRLISTSTLCDIYYRPPQGKKLRSRNDVTKFLEKISAPFNLQHFSFNHAPLGFGEPYEVVRNANFFSGRFSANSSIDHIDKKLKEGKRCSQKKINCNSVDTTKTANASKEISKIMNKIKLALNKDDNSYRIVKNKENNRSTSFSGNKSSKESCLSGSESLNGSVIIVQEELEECVGKLHTNSVNRQIQKSNKYSNTLSFSKKRKLLESDILNATNKRKKLSYAVSKVKKLSKADTKTSVAGSENHKLFEGSSLKKKRKLALKDCNNVAIASVRSENLQSISQLSLNLSTKTSPVKKMLTTDKRVIKSTYNNSTFEIKHPLMPAMRHFYDVMDEVKGNNPTLKNFEISRIIDCMWRNIDAEKKKKYEDDYLQQMLIFEKNREQEEFGKKVANMEEKYSSHNIGLNLREAVINAVESGLEKGRIDSNSCKSLSIPVFQMSVNDYSEISFNSDDENTSFIENNNAVISTEAACPPTSSVSKFSGTSRPCLKWDNKNKKVEKIPRIKNNTASLNIANKAACPITIIVPKSLEAAKIKINFDGKSEGAQKEPLIKNNTAAISLSSEAACLIINGDPKFSENSKICLNSDNKSDKAPKRACIENDSAAIRKSGEAGCPITGSISKISETARISLNLDDKHEKAPEKSCIENDTAAISKSDEAGSSTTSSISKISEPARSNLNSDDKNEKAPEKPCIENVSAAMSKSDEAGCPITNSVQKFPEAPRIRVRPMEELFAKPLEEKYPAVVVDQIACTNKLAIFSQSKCSYATSSSGLVNSSPMFLFPPNSNIQNAIPISSTVVHSSHETSIISSSCQTPVRPLPTMMISSSNQFQNDVASSFPINHSNSNNVGQIPTSPFLVINNSKINQNQQCLTYGTSSTRNIQQQQKHSLSSHSNSPISFLRNVRFEPSASICRSTDSNNSGKWQCSTQTSNSMQSSFNNNKRNSVRYLNPTPTNSVSYCTTNQPPISNCLTTNPTLLINTVPFMPNNSMIPMQANPYSQFQSNEKGVSLNAASSTARGLPLLISTSFPSPPMHSAIVSLPSHSVNPLPEHNNLIDTGVIGLIHKNVNSPYLGTNVPVNVNPIQHYPSLRPFSPLHQQQEVLAPAPVAKLQETSQNISANQRKTLSSNESVLQSLNSLASTHVASFYPVSAASQGLKTTEQQSPKNSNSIPKSINDIGLSNVSTCTSINLLAEPKPTLNVSKVVLSNEITKNISMLRKNDAVKKQFKPQQSKYSGVKNSLQTLKNLKSPGSPNCQFSYFSTKKSKASKNKLSSSQLDKITSVKLDLVQSSRLTAFKKIDHKSSEMLEKNSSFVTKSPLTKTSMTVSSCPSKTLPDPLLNSSTSKTSPVNAITTSTKHLSNGRLVRTQNGEDPSVVSSFSTYVQPISSAFETTENQFEWDPFSSKNAFPSIFSDSILQEEYSPYSENLQIESFFSVPPISFETEEDRSPSPQLGIISEVFSLKDRNGKNDFGEEDISELDETLSENSPQASLNADAAFVAHSKSPDASVIPLNVEPSLPRTDTPLAKTRTLTRNLSSQTTKPPPITCSTSTTCTPTTCSPSITCIEASKSQKLVIGNIFLFNLNLSNLKGYENLFSSSNVFAVVEITANETGELLAIRIEKNNCGQAYVQASGTVIFSGSRLLKDDIREVKIINFSLNNLLPAKISLASSYAASSSTPLSNSPNLSKSFHEEQQHSSTLAPSIPIFDNIQLPESINAIETIFS